MSFNVTATNCDCAFVRNLIRIIETRFEKRNGVSGKLYLQVNPNLEAEEFCIAGTKNLITLSAGTKEALYFGAGKILRTASYDSSGATFGIWRGQTKPKKKYRIAYLAAHFFNTYQTASLEFIREYIEDLVLLGYNYLCLASGSFYHYENFDVPDFQENVAREAYMYKLAAELGLKTVFGVSNIGFCNTPMELRAIPTGRSFFGLEICPSNPLGMDLIKFNNLRYLEMLGNFRPDILMFWPYDQGGCGCKKCFPYGYNGYLQYAKTLAATYQNMFPGVKTILSTWLFDFIDKNDKEWAGLYEKIANEETSWLDIILADSHDEFPQFPLSHGVPDGKEMICFPEISMFNRHPWGGFGANPMPQRFSKIISKCIEVVSGGMIYSEGIFEDFNKALYASFFWNGNNSIEEAIVEYANYEFGTRNILEFNNAIKRLEDNHGMLIWWLQGKPEMRLKNKHVYSTPVIDYKFPDVPFEIFDGIVNHGLPWVKYNWRAEIFMIRAELDLIFYKNGGEPDKRCEELLERLFEIYKLDIMRSQRRVTPFTDRWLQLHATDDLLEGKYNE